MPSLPASAPAADGGPLTARGFVTAIAIGIGAFALYHATLLPGLDLGDTASFQATVGSPVLTPRDGYPLYFAIGDLFRRVVPAEPARALNVASAVEGGVAAALLVLAGAELCGSVAVAAGGALLFAVSYTFWSQAILAEVYALHAVFVSLTLLLILHWERRQRLWTLALFFAAYALGFGNHLSMVLLLPGYAAFLLVSARDGWRSMFRPSILALAATIACAGALQYAGELRSLWLMPQPPHRLLEGVQRFWFDVTKTDWRETMVLNVPRGAIADRAAMYWFDVRQQFGPVVPFLAAIGLVALTRRHARRGLLLALLYLVNVAFAFGYNVGDAHVFYLPSHLLLALLAACGVTAIAAVLRATTPIAAAALVAYAIVRGYHDFPAIDRSADLRPSIVLGQLMAGADDQHDIVLADLNWQLQNGLAYFAKVTAPQVAYARMPDVLLYAPALIADNAAIGRRVLLTERARTSIETAYGPLIVSERDPRVAAPRVADVVRGLPAGTRYVMTILKPSRDLALDVEDASEALRMLTGGRMATAITGSDYAAVAGLVGEPPAYIAAASRPFQRQIELGAVPIEVRMDAWLSADTIRRMGFGHVIAARRHTLIVERGVSFVAFDQTGRPLRTTYAANIFAPQPRYVVRLRSQ